MLSLSDLLPVGVVDDTVASEALFHGEAPAAARVRTGEGPQLFVERADVTLEVKGRGERPLAAVSGTLQHQPRLAVDLLVLP